MGRKQQTWVPLSACRGLSKQKADEFFKERKHEYSDFVKATCASCPVASDCLDYGTLHERYGYWGGKTEKERDAIRTEQEYRLAVDAIRGGWLEPHHLLSKDLVTEVEELVGYLEKHPSPQNHQRIRPTLSETLQDFLDFVVPLPQENDLSIA